MAAPRKRTVEELVARRLKTHGAVLITGPKAVGKTTTARTLAASEVRLDQDRAARTVAETDPRLILEGDYPRLIDEYQLAAGMWDAVRGRIDDLGQKGLFLLTGSSTPEDDPARHTGARRIAPVPMRTMTLLERDLSTGHVCVGGLLEGDPVSPGRPASSSFAIGVTTPTSPAANAAAPLQEERLYA